jgi:beta-glucosidase
VIFGDYNPAGRLPVTFYKSIADVPPFENYSMMGRTYRYFSGEPLYPFGYGLSYSAFDYSGFSLSKSAAGTQDSLEVTVTVKNSGRYDGDEVVQLYVRNLTEGQPQPLKSLRGFSRVSLKKGESRAVHIPLRVSDLKYYDEAKNGFVVAPGKYEVQVGASSADIRAKGSLELR